MTPRTVKPGGTVTITGTGFGGGGTVEFNGVSAASIGSWANDSITATILSTNVSGATKIDVSVDGGGTASWNGGLTVS